jgi:5-methylcytosine-specific restriction endonuclease McrA
MPRRAPSPCPTPGCPALVDRAGPCPACRNARRQSYRTSPDARARRKVYDSRRWAGVRRTVLRAQPYCAEPDCPELATEVDHVTALRDDGDPFDLANLQALCHRHHAAKTAREVLGRRVYTR